MGHSWPGPIGAVVPRAIARALPPMLPEFLEHGDLIAAILVCVSSLARVQRWASAGIRWG